MAHFTVGKGIDTYLANLEKTMVHKDAMIKHAVYEGAKVVADEIHNEILGLPISPREWSGKQYISTKQRDGLLHGLGISHMDHKSGYVNVRIGFNGYNDEITENYPIGQPNALIARSLISGTSFRRKNNFVDRAVRRCHKKAEAAMQKGLDEYFNRGK